MLHLISRRCLGLMNQPCGLTSNSVTNVGTSDVNFWFCLDFRWTRERAEVALQGLVCAEPEEISALWYLWYIASCDGYQRICSCENGAQVSIVVIPVCFSMLACNAWPHASILMTRTGRDICSLVSLVYCFMWWVPEDMFLWCLGAYDMPIGLCPFPLIDVYTFWPSLHWSCLLKKSLDKSTSAGFSIFARAWITVYS